MTSAAESVAPQYSWLPFGLNRFGTSKRARSVLATVVALGLIALAIGLGVGLSGSPRSVGAAPHTNLTLLASTEFGGHVTRFHLTCRPAGGNVPNPAQACAAIAAQPSVITKPKPFTCLMTAWQFTIIGQMNGRPVHTKVLSCWTPQMPLIRALGLGLR